MRTRRRSFAGAVIAISGGGSGLGRALAGRYAARGATVALLDRDVAAARDAALALERSAGRALAIECDVTSTQQCVDAIAATVRECGRLDGLVNNAGISHRSAFARTDLDVLRRVIEVNLHGAIQLTHAALPHLVAARGTIVAISSVAGYTPLVARTAYAASKHGLHGFFGSLRAELGPAGVDVLVACPSFVATGIERNALGGRGGTAGHAQVVVGPRLAADAVAERIVDASERGRREIRIGRTAHAAWWLHRLAPAVYERIMARRLREEMEAEA